MKGFSYIYYLALQYVGVKYYMALARLSQWPASYHLNVKSSKLMNFAYFCQLFLTFELYRSKISAVWEEI